MFENDYILRQIQFIVQSLSVLLLGKDFAMSIVSEEAEDKEGLVIKEEELLEYMLKKYIGEGEINKAENLLFESIIKNKYPKYLEIALSFYDELNNLDESALNKYNFSKQEIF